MCLISLTLAADLQQSRRLTDALPSLNAARMRPTLIGVIGGRPSRLLSRRARSRPASIRSRIIAEHIVAEVRVTPGFRSDCSA